MYLRYRPAATGVQLNFSMSAIITECNPMFAMPYNTRADWYRYRAGARRGVAGAVQANVTVPLNALWDRVGLKSAPAGYAPRLLRIAHSDHQVLHVGSAEQVQRRLAVAHHPFIDEVLHGGVDAPSGQVG